MSSFIKANQGLSLAIAAMTAVSVAAVAQTAGSPFASKKKTQAWETDAARPNAQTPSYQAPTYQAPTYQAPSYQAPTYQAPSYQAPQNQAAPTAAPTYIPPPNYTPPADIVSAPSTAPTTYNAPSSYSAPTSYAAPHSYSAPPAPSSTSSYTPNYSEQGYSAPTPAPKSYTAPPLAKTQPPQNYGSYAPQNSTAPTASIGVAEPDLLPGYRPRVAGQAGAYYPGREDKGGFSVPAYAPRGQAAQTNYAGQYNQQGYTAPNMPPQYNGAHQGGPLPTGGPSYGPPNTRPQYAKQSWKDRLGLGNLLTTFSTVLKVGVAGLNRKNTVEDEGWNAAFIADGKITGEVSAITRGGLEYGVGGEIRGQYDKYRRGFGGKVGDCGTGTVDFVPGCNSIGVDGTAQPLRGHTSQFYSAGIDNAKEAEFAVEGAYLFLRSAYGDVTIGRDDGAAYLFSLGAPTLLAVNASNSPVDYTGLDSVRTVNEASGFSEKIAYVSPRLLGDQIGVGVQLGASYAPNARACGVDYCVRSNGKDGSTALSPDLKNVVEFGLALDRTFSNGLSIEGTATYASASEDSDFVFADNTGFDDLKSFGLGLEAEYGPWTLGGSYLNSNNGLKNGDYEAYDIGLTFKPAQWGVSASYGHATDKNVNLLSDQATLGFIYDFQRFTLGTGVQYIERDVVGIDGGLFAPRREKATALFIEGGVKF